MKHITPKWRQLTQQRQAQQANQQQAGLEVEPDHDEEEEAPADTGDEAAAETQDAEEQPGEEEEDPGEGEEETTGEVVVTIGDETPPDDEAELEGAPQWVRDLRKTHRETQRENRELRKRLETAEAAREERAAPQRIEVGPKPTLKGLDYDSDKYETELAAWYERKRQADEQAAAAEAEKQAQEAAWNKQLQGYGEARDKLNVPDFAEAEEIALGTLNKVQQGCIVQGADNPALVMYALGKNPAKAEELAKITDPVKFSFAVAKLEKDLKVKPRKPATQPERQVTGTGRTSGTVDSELERLRAEAEKTGDYTKVSAYKRRKRQKA